MAGPCCRGRLKTFPHRSSRREPARFSWGLHKIGADSRPLLQFFQTVSSFSLRLLPLAFSLQPSAFRLASQPLVAPKCSDGGSTPNSQRAMDTLYSAISRLLTAICWRGIGARRDLRDWPLSDGVCLVS